MVVGTAAESSPHDHHSEKKDFHYDFLIIQCETSGVRPKQFSARNPANSNKSILAYT